MNCDYFLTKEVLPKKMFPLKVVGRTGTPFGVSHCIIFLGGHF